MAAQGLSRLRLLRAKSDMAEPRFTWCSGQVHKPVSFPNTMWLCLSRACHLKYMKYIPTLANRAVPVSWGRAIWSFRMNFDIENLNQNFRSKEDSCVEVKHRLVSPRTPAVRLSQITCQGLGRVEEWNEMAKWVTSNVSHTSEEGRAGVGINSEVRESGLFQWHFIGVAKCWIM